MNKILIVEDDQDLRELLCYNLEKEGFKTEQVENGDEVLFAAQKFKPDLIILDIMIPKKDGVEVCEMLRSKSMFDNTLIVFLTARSEDFTQIACYENGGDDFIIKPIKPKVLVSRINALLRRRSINNNNDRVSIFGDIRINHDKSLVTKNEEEVKLARKEFELLILLSSKSGKLFSRKEIFNKIWGVEMMIGDRTIDVHIRKLREKLGDNFIQTVKGLGYKINEFGLKN
jgi:two-component system, OmpR family, alkaline phosphatase synthesis response regulator PhoP